MSTMTLDAGIPLLTEIIADPASFDNAAAIPHPPSIPGFLLKENVVAATPQPVIWDQAQIDRMERKIIESILQDMLDRIDFVLEQRIRDSLSDVLQNAMGGLMIEIRQGVQETLENVITRAVSQEIAKLQSSKN
jgi:hypothetical protein